MTSERKQRLLAFLTDEGGKPYYDGLLDGIWGPGSREAAERFIKDFTGITDEPAGLWDGIKHFTPKEFACKCGDAFCDGFPVQPNRILLELSDDVREHFDTPMVVSSGVRCEIHNENVGGAAASRHKYGKAVDFCIPGKTAVQILAHVKQDSRVRYAYDIDGTYVHMDVE